MNQATIMQLIAEHVNAMKSLEQSIKKERAIIGYLEKIQEIINPIDVIQKPTDTFTIKRQEIPHKPIANGEIIHDIRDSSTKTKADSMSAVTSDNPPSTKQPINPPSTKPINPPSTKPINPPSTKPINPPSTKPINPPSTKPDAFYADQIMKMVPFLPHDGDLRRLSMLLDKQTPMKDHCSHTQIPKTLQHPKTTTTESPKSKQLKSMLDFNARQDKEKNVDTFENCLAKVLLSIGCEKDDSENPIEDDMYMSLKDILTLGEKQSRHKEEPDTPKDSKTTQQIRPTSLDYEILKGIIPIIDEYEPQQSDIACTHKIMTDLLESVLSGKQKKMERDPCDDSFNFGF